MLYVNIKISLIKKMNILIELKTRSKGKKLVTLFFTLKRVGNPDKMVIRIIYHCEIHCVNDIFYLVGA